MEMAGDRIVTVGPRTLRINQFLASSRANGPGSRAVIWVQGCSLGCRGCFNPEMHSITGGHDVVVDDLFEQIVALGDAIEGITISGGEPFQQRESLLALLRRVKKETQLSTLVFTGYSWDEIKALLEREALPMLVDVLVAGRYEQAQHLGHGLRGSENQTIHLFGTRYTLDDLCAVPPAEVILSTEGDVIISGIDPPAM